MRKEEPDGFITHKVYYDSLREFDDVTLGKFYRNLIDFCDGKEVQPMDPVPDAVFKIVTCHITKDMTAYAEKCRRNRENIKKRWDKDHQDEEDNTDDLDDATACDCIRPYTNDTTVLNDTTVPKNTAVPIGTYISNVSNVSNVSNIKESNISKVSNVNINKKDVCALQADAPAELMPFTFMLKDGTYHRISKTDYKNLQEAYPNVKLDIELKKMVLWCSDPANAQKRKTKKGIMKFIRSWLGRSEAPVVIQKPEPANKVHEQRRYDFDALEKALTGRG